MVYFSRVIFADPIKSWMRGCPHGGYQIGGSYGPEIDPNASKTSRRPSRLMADAFWNRKYSKQCLHGCFHHFPCPTFHHSPTFHPTHSSHYTGLKLVNT